MAEPARQRGRRLTAGDPLLQRAPKDGRVRLRVEVLGAADVRAGQGPVALQQPGTVRVPLRTAVLGGQPVAEQFVLEGPPDREGLALRPDGGPLGAEGECSRHLARGTAVDGVRAGSLTVRGPGGGARPGGEGPQLVQEFPRGGVLSGPQQPGHGEQGALLGCPQDVPPGVQQGPQPAQALVGEAVREDLGAGGVGGGGLRCGVLVHGRRGRSCPCALRLWRPVLRLLSYTP